MFKTKITPCSTTTAIAKNFIRGKKQTAVNPSTQRVVNQLSALSASRKQPKLISLNNEDLIKHKTINNAWKLYQRKITIGRNEQLDKQYKSIVNAMENLKNLSPELFEAAKNNHTTSKTRFPLEMRIPTEYPPNQPWVYNYAKQN